MKLEDRVRKNMLGKGTRCPFFYINRDNEWCLRKGFHRDIPLITYSEEALDDLFDGLLENDLGIKTIMNIEQIKKEIWSI